ncbi:MAG TPA: hypothetical protein VJB10_00690 [Candidatus Peribacteraceae bacterium]|nr:hypothetical protein [Candidatus Peribacteraceae bacterium]
MKVRKFLHGFCIVLLAIAGSTVLVLLLSAATNMLTLFDKTAASFLPAETTLALLHNPPREENDLIPELRDMMRVEAAALLALSETERVPVFFWRTADHQAGHSLDLGAYIVTSPSEEALELLAAGATTPLSEDAAYRQLSNGRERSSSWTFVRRQVLQSAQDLPQQLLEALLFQGSTALAIVREGDTQTITLLGMDEEYPPRTGIHPLPKSHTGDILAMTIRQGQEIWQQTMESMSEEHQIIFKGTVEYLVQRGFGEAVSLQYDVLPLTEKECSLFLTRSESGTLLVLARGKMDDSDHLALIMERLHRGMRLRLPTATVRNYSFDNKFFTRNIRRDSSEWKEELSMQGDWQIRSTQAAHSPTGLFTATRKGEFAITNTEELLSALDAPATQKEGAAPLSRSLLSNTRQSSGWLSKATVLPLMETHLPLFVGKINLPLLPDLPPVILWSTDRRGPLTTIMLQPGS